MASHFFTLMTRRRRGGDRGSGWHFEQTPPCVHETAPLTGGEPPGSAELGFLTHTHTHTQTASRPLPHFHPSVEEKGKLLLSVWLTWPEASADLCSTKVKRSVLTGLRKMPPEVTFFPPHISSFHRLLWLFFSSPLLSAPSLSSAE